MLGPYCMSLWGFLGRGWRYDGELKANLLLDLEPSAKTDTVSILKEFGRFSVVHKPLHLSPEFGIQVTKRWHFSQIKNLDFQLMLQRVDCDWPAVRESVFMR